MKLKITTSPKVKILLFILFSCCSIQSQVFNNDSIKRIVWDEAHSFQPCKHKIILNNDGSNSVIRHCGGKSANLDTAKIISKGCIFKHDGDEDEFIVENFWNAEEGKKIFDSLLSLGIQKLKSVKATACDGSEVDLLVITQNKKYSSIINIPGYPENSDENKILKKCRELLNNYKIGQFFYLLIDCD